MNAHAGVEVEVGTDAVRLSFVSLRRSRQVHAAVYLALTAIELSITARHVHPWPHFVAYVRLHWNRYFELPLAAFVTYSGRQ